jgi:mRNA-degrading endonuclease toxin of MazEF toxin-antitoxin module
MAKDFDGWNEQKKRIHGRPSSPHYHEREIWWCAFGVNVGSEQDGSGPDRYRPALILKGMSAATCLAVPLTTSTHEHPLRPPIGVVDGKSAHVLLSQMRIIDTKRLMRKIGYLDMTIFEEIRKTARAML